MSAESAFTEAVASFAHGNRYDNYLRVVRLGLNAGLGPDAVFDYVMTNAPGQPPNPIKVRDAIRYAIDHDRKTNGKRRTVSASPVPSAAEEREKRRQKLSLEARQFVPVTLRGYGSTAFTGRATADIIDELVRMTDADLALDERAYRRQAADQLRALHGNALIWAGSIIKRSDGTGTDKTPVPPTSNDELFDPRRRAGIVRSDILADMIERGRLAKIPTHVSLNPVSGTSGTTADGRQSFDCLGTVAAFRHVLVEFDALKDADGMPSKNQIDIVAGLLDHAQETGLFRVACAVYSGGKSIHVVLDIPATDRDEYVAQCSILADLFASSDDPDFRVDLTGWTTGANAATHLRLAGAVRPETGRRQRLLWCRGS